MQTFFFVGENKKTFTAVVQQRYTSIYSVKFCLRRQNAAQVLTTLYTYYLVKVWFTQTKFLHKF